MSNRPAASPGRPPLPVGLQLSLYRFRINLPDMFLRELRKIARPHWFDILFTVKRSLGLSVSDLAKSMKMSYMGVKQHCVDMEKKGFLETWRRPKDVGRPEKIYRLTKRANVFFPNFYNDFTKELMVAVGEAYGANAPEKLVYTYLSGRVPFYQHHVKGESLFDRATSFAIIRNREGYLCVCEHDGTLDPAIQLIEYHNPMRELFDQFPSTLRMEQTMMEHVLKARVTRTTHDDAAGLSRTVFGIHP